VYSLILILIAKLVFERVAVGLIDFSDFYTFTRKLKEVQRDRRSIGSIGQTYFTRGHTASEAFHFRFVPENGLKYL